MSLGLLAWLGLPVVLVKCVLSVWSNNNTVGLLDRCHAARTKPQSTNQICTFGTAKEQISIDTFSPTYMVPFVALARLSVTIASTTLI